MNTVVKKKHSETLYNIPLIWKNVILLLIVFLPLVAFAQSAGGQIKRPVQKHQSSTKSTKKDSKSEKKVNNRNKEGRADRPQSHNFGIDDTSVNAQQQRILNNIVANMVYVQGGSFLMGGTSEQGNEAEDDEKPIHQVTLSSFYIGKYEITQEEWKAVMGNNPSYHKGDKYPVGNVTWDETQKFISKLNQLTGRQFRLPTEAEWEFAARGGNNSRQYKYSGSNYIGSIAWYADNSNRTLHDVGQKQPNELGLYDMSGNVSEWCSDYYGFYSPNAQKDPEVTSPTTDNIGFGYSGYIKMGIGRIIRGGSYSQPHNTLFRVSRRYCFRQDYHFDNVGFRLAM